MWQNYTAILLSLITFIAGLRVMRTGFEHMAAGKLPLIIQRFVSTPARGIVTGCVTTGLVQSSAALTAITVGLVASGTITFRNALGVILGANVGSTITPQLLSLNLWIIVIPALLFGLIGLLTRQRALRAPSQASIGFASVFISLEALQTALHPVTALPWFRTILAFAGHQPLIAVLAGTFLSAAIQSSTATTLITMALASGGSIPLEGAIAIVLGANIGTCATSILAALGQSRESMQAALAHVILNVGGVAVFIPLLGGLTRVSAHFGGTPAQQIANAHTIFNLACTLAVWPITRRFADFIERLFPNQSRA